MSGRLPDIIALERLWENRKQERVLWEKRQNPAV